MPAEDEAMTMVLRVGDTVVQSAEQIVLMLLRALADAQRQGADRRAVAGRDGVIRRAVRKPVEAVTSRIAGLGERGIVSQKVANPDGKSTSYVIDAGVLTQGDLKKLGREFATRNMQVGIINDTPAAAGEFMNDDRLLDRVEFTVKREQIEMFETALSRIVPDAVDRSFEKGGQKASLARKEGETLDGAKILDGRDDLKLMCNALNDNGISVAFARDATGCVEIHAKGSADIDAFQESLKVAAKAYGLTDDQISMKPIERGERGEYPDAFSYQGMSFNRARAGSDTWVACDPDDSRTEISVSVERGRPAYQITRNGNVLAASSQDREFYFAHEQPVESGCLAAVSALDRSKRTAEREAASKEIMLRGKALSGSGRKRDERALPATAKRNAEAVRVARRASEKTAKSDEGRSQGVTRR